MFPKRFTADAATPGGASIHPDLLTPWDSGYAGIVFRSMQTVCLWGMPLHVPSHRMSRDWLWRLKTQSYEREEASALLHHMDRSLPLIEVGGGLGAVACAINRRLDNPVQHMVVEMDLEMAMVCDLNRKLTRSHFKVICGAVSTGPVQLKFRDNFIGQQALPNGDIPIQWFTLRKLLERVDSSNGINLFMDVEGMELDLINHDPSFFRDHVRVLILELHGHKAEASQIAYLPITLHQIGFKPIWTRGTVWVFRKESL